MRATSFSWKRLLGILLIQLGAILLILFAAEVFVRCWREKGVRAGLVSLLGGTGTQIDPGAHGALVLDADLGYRLSSDLEGVNALGFRGPEVGSPKPSGCFRILVLGDSIAWDFGGFPSVLSSRITQAASDGTGGPGRLQLMPGVEILNASVPGYTTYQERIFLERLLGPVQPDVVVLEYCLNDNHRFLHRLTEDGGWLLTSEARAELLPAGDGIPARVARWSYLAFEVRKRLLSLRRRRGAIHPWEGDPEFGPAWRPETWPAEREQILAIQAAVRSAGARLLVLAVPYEPQLEPGLLARDRDLALFPQARLASICAEAGIPFLDLAPAFESHAEANPREALFRDRIHLTPAGHAIAGATLFERLCTERLLPIGKPR
jgi:lysophospholipase L1-like esterase